MAIPSVLSDLAFFQQNLVLYDWKSKKSREIQSLEELDAPIVCFGEHHLTRVMDEVECETSRRLGKNVPCCVLLEGLRSGDTAKTLPGWENLPENILFKGSDVRHSGTLETFIRGRTVARRHFTLFHQRKTAYEAMVRDWADKLNTAVINHLPLESVIDSLATQKEIEAIDGELEHITILEKLQSPEMRKSNEGLFKEIVEASSQFSKVIVFWGMAHFVLGDRIFEQLERLKKKYVIVIPNDKIQEEARIEQKWQKHQIEPLLLSIPGSTKTLTIPQIFRSYFHPIIQALLPPVSTPSPVKIDPLKLLELCKKRGDRLEFSPTKEAPLHVSGMSTDDLLDIEDALQRNTKTGALTALPHFMNCMAKAFNSMLLLGNSSLKSGSVSCAIMINIINQDRPFLEFFSKRSETFILEITSGSSVGDAHHLFSEMKRQGVDFIMKPQSNLLFLDITPEELNVVAEHPESQLFPWLNSRAPHGTAVEGEGDVLIFSAPYGDKRGLFLVTETGLRLFLKDV